MIMVLEHLAYSPGLAPYDFFLFLTMNNYLKGSHFKTPEEIQKVKMAVINSLKENDFWK
jgi:hypothetical protein